MEDYYIGEHCTRVTQNRGEALSCDVKQDLVDQFHRQKRRLDKYHHGSTLDFELKGKNIDIQLTQDIVQETFDEVMKEPLQEVSEILKSWGPSNKGSGRWLIVSGGSARSKALRHRLETLCKARRQLPPWFVHEETSGLHPLVSLEFDTTCGHCYYCVLLIANLCKTNA